MTDVNKKYSRYNGTEIERQVLCPSQASMCSKIQKFVEIGATAGSGTNYESSYVRLAIEKLSKR